MKITYIGQLFNYIFNKLKKGKYSISNKPYMLTKSSSEQELEPELVSFFDKMKSIYQPKDKDWMEYIITKKNRLRAYPIIESDKSDMTNYALLTKTAKQDLQTLKNYYPELYEEYIYMLKIINDMHCPPILEIRKIMLNLKSRMNAALGVKSSEYNKYIK